MEEPSVLDYLKSKLNPWARSRVEIPSPEIPPGAPPPAEIEPGPEAAPIRWPWRSLAALLLALAAQFSFEPPRDDPQMVIARGVGLFTAALVFLVWAWWQGEWAAAPLGEAAPAADPLTFRRTELILSAVFALAAFVTFSDNLFTRLNVSLWLIAIALFVRAFWLPRHSLREHIDRLREFLQRPSWQLPITRWGLVVLAAAGIVLFFRLYDLGGVPAEPFSDHAEKLLDVYDVTIGQTHIFFPRNTGREFFQMYLTAAVAAVFGTGLSFISLKIGTALCGLAALPFIYLTGKEIANRRVGLLALLLAGMSYWPNVISRVGLRFPIYPLFTAPALYFLIRGLKRSNRNDFILSGLFLGLGLHGYSPFRFVPLVILIAVGLYWLHRQSRGMRRQSLMWLVILILASLLVFLPLLRYALENPQDVAYRSLTRLTSSEAPLPGPVWEIFLRNLWNSLTMFQWSNGEIWVHSIPFRPAVDVVSGALLILGAALVLLRYLRERHWVDLFLLLAVPLLMMPSILSLAFPGENPSLNRSGGAIVPVFLLAALALDGLLSSVEKSLAGRRGSWAALGMGALLLFSSGAQNYDLVFRKYNEQFRLGAWNTSDMGRIIAQFADSVGSADNAWVVPYPYWVDTRLVGVWAGYPTRDFAKWRDDLPQTSSILGPKLFLVKADDLETLAALQQLYPLGALSLYTTPLPGKDFYIYFVPAGQ